MTRISTRQNSLPVAVQALIVCVVIATFLTGFWYDLVGDDLAYEGTVGRYWGWMKYPRWIAHYWLNINGRLSNFISPPLLALPHPLMAAINALAIGAMTWLMIKCASATRLTSTLGGVLMIAAVTLTLPWWDSIIFFNVSLNYVVAMLVMLWFIQMMFYDSRSFDGSRGWLLLCVAFAAGCMHEAMSLPFAIALWIWLLWRSQGGSRWSTMDQARRVAVIAFTVATALCFFAPGIWLRFFNETNHRTPDDSALILTLKSNFWVLLLIALTVWAYFKRRSLLKELMATPWAVIAGAAVLSIPIVITSGIVGRTGWFGQCLALIAIWQFAVADKWRLTRTPAVVVGSLMAALTLGHLAAVAAWQYKLGAELRRANQMVAQHPGKQIYMDYTPSGNRPWYLLGRGRGVVDYTETYPLRMLSEWRGDSITAPYILPLSVRNASPGTSVANGYVTDKMPTGREVDGLIWLTNSSPYTIAVPYSNHGTPMWYVTERTLPAGNRPPF